MTTELAFEIMIAKRGIYKQLGIAKGTVGKIRYDLKHGKTISINQKISLLQKAGFVIIQDLRWTLAGSLVKPKDKKEIDYLHDFPGLTFIGRSAGMHDETIRRANESIVRDPKRFAKIYRQLT